MRLNLLKENDIIYIYGINRLYDNKEFVYKRKAKVTKLFGKHHPVEVTVVCDESTVPKTVPHKLKLYYDSDDFCRNVLWLAEEDDKKAYEIISKFINEKIKQYKKELLLYENRIEMVNDFFESL